MMVNVIQSSGEERKKTMEEMTEYIRTPNTDRGVTYGFGHGFAVNYKWDGDEADLLKLCERLTSNRMPEYESGVEYEEVDVENGEYKSYADFVLD